MRQIFFELYDDFLVFLYIFYLKQWYIIRRELKDKIQIVVRMKLGVFVNLIDCKNMVFYYYRFYNLNKLINEDEQEIYSLVVIVGDVLVFIVRFKGFENVRFFGFVSC